MEPTKIRETASLTEWTVHTRVASACGFPSTRSVATNDWGAIWVARRSASKFQGSSGLIVAEPEGAFTGTWSASTKSADSILSWSGSDAGRLWSAIVRQRVYSG